MSIFNKKTKKVASGAVNLATSSVGGVFRLVMKSLLTVILICLTTGMIFTCIFAIYVKSCLSTDLSITIEDFSLDLSSTLYYEGSDGTMKELTTLYGTENRIWVESEIIPDNLKYAAVAIEDQRFYTHKGVDWYRTVGAFANMFISMKNDFGGSTITQQLIKNITLNDDITVQRKLLEIFQALELEKNYTKDEIVYYYLNVIYLGSGAYGVGAAAEMYFGKSVDELSLAECASIVGITNNPSLYSPYVSVDKNKERQELILREMYEQGYIESYEQYQAAVDEELVFVRNVNEETNTEIYSYYVEVVISDVLQDLMDEKGISLTAAKQLLYSGGYQVYTCIDMDIQDQVDYIYEDFNNLPTAWSPSTQQFQSAICIMDPYTGEIVALSGGTGEKSSNFELNRFYSERPPGSSFKPVSVYAPALDVGLITQYTQVNDAPSTEIQLSGTSWYPNNSGGGNRGITTIRQALISSINTVAAQILDKLSLQTSYDYLTQRLGFTLAEGDLDYAPLSLGQLTNGTTVRNMAQAYTSFVNDGVMTYGRTYSLVLDSNGNVVLDNQPDTVTAFKANTAWNVTNMLEAAATYGTGSEAYLGYMPVAGKTGTTSSDYDRYFVGYTPYYVAAVWTGYDTPEAMRFSGNPATQIWKSIMDPIHQDLEYVAFPTPDVGGVTNIFGDLTVEEEEEEEEVEEEVPEETPEPTPTPTPEASTNPYWPSASETDIPETEEETEPDPEPEVETEPETTTETE